MLLPYGGHLRACIGCDLAHSALSQRGRRILDLLFSTLNLLLRCAGQHAFLRHDTPDLLILRLLLDRAVHKALLAGLDRRVVRISAFFVLLIARHVRVGNACCDSLSLRRLRFLIL